MPIYPGSHCSICGENPNLAYICDDCSELVCEDCIDIKVEQNFVCFSCGSIDIQSNKNGTLYCKQCHNDDVRSSKKIIPTCRNCGSEKIRRIEEKQQDILEKYKAVINQTRQYLEPLEEEAQRLNQMRSMLIQLREDTPQCFHYIGIESEILTGLKLFENGKSSIYERVNQFFKEVQRNIHYITEIFITHPENLTYIAEVIRLFEREHAKVVRASISVAQAMKETFSPMEEKLIFMDEIQTMFNSFLGKFNLEAEEKIIFGIKCKLSAGSHQNQDINNKNGTILITSKRMYFFHEQGVFKKRTVLLFSVELSDLQHVEVKGRLKKKVSLDFVRSMYQFSLTKEGREELISWIEKAAEFEQTNQIDMSNYRSVYKFKFHVKGFREELENAIYKLIGFQGSTHNPSGSTSAANQIVNAPLYRTSRLPLNPTLNKVNQSPHSFSNPTSPMASRYGENEGLDQNLMGDPHSEIRSQKTYKTPHGHYGYPHDSINIGSNKRRVGVSDSFYPNISQQGSSNPLGSNQSGYLGGGQQNYNNFEPSDPFNPSMGTRFNAHSNGPQFGGNNGGSYVPQNNSYMGARGMSSNNEYKAKQELRVLQQDEFALNQTIRALEQKFDSGYLNNPEFVKSYKELQRQKFQIQAQIQGIQKYLTENFEYRSN